MFILHILVYVIIYFVCKDGAKRWHAQNNNSPVLKLIVCGAKAMAKATIEVMDGRWSGFGIIIYFIQGFGMV